MHIPERVFGGLINISILFLSIALTGCGQQDSSLLSNTNTGGDNQEETNLSGKVRLSATISIASGKPSSEIANATVYAIGQESQKVTTNSNGEFTLLVDAKQSGVVLQKSRALPRMDSTPPARNQYGIVVSSSSREHGKKFEVTGNDGDDITLPSPVEITEVGSISGRVTLQNQTDNTGIMVYIPGTSFMALTDSSGNFTISSISETSYSATVSFTLSSGDGTKTVYVWFRDSAGNVSASASDNITLTTTVTDIDGNVYNMVTIGTQVWMKENLKVTKYRNGDAIPTTTSSITNDSSSKYQWAYDNDESNVATYGRLYTWYAATDSRGVCPTGWHVPTDDEWTTLTDYLGGESVAGGKMKEAGTTHWNSPNTGADNSSGFTALPGGYRNDSGTFYVMGSNGYWWSTAENGTTEAWVHDLFDNSRNTLRGNGSKDYGYSVRCVRD